jgi:SAM-dependent methyltransferase
MRLHGRIRGLLDGGALRGADWYDDDYSRYSGWREPYYRSRYCPMWAVIVDRVRRAGVQRVLEVGCGSGQLASYLIGDGHVRSYAGVDFSRQAIEIARQAAPDGTFIVGDAVDPRTYEGDFDCIICTEVLEHLADDLRVVSLFPHGTRCLCTVPDFRYPSHLRHFTSVEAVVQRYGPAFADLDVVVFKGQGHGRSQVLRYFLIDGVRT